MSSCVWGLPLSPLLEQELPNVDLFLYSLSIHFKIVIFINFWSSNVVSFMIDSLSWTCDSHFLTAMYITSLPSVSLELFFWTFHLVIAFFFFSPLWEVLLLFPDSLFLPPVLVVSLLHSFPPLLVLLPLVLVWFFGFVSFSFEGANYTWIWYFWSQPKQWGLRSAL